MNLIIFKVFRNKYVYIPKSKEKKNCNIIDIKQKINMYRNNRRQHHKKTCNAFLTLLCYKKKNKTTTKK